jgi:hypothetical protein
MIIRTLYAGCGHPGGGDLGYPFRALPLARGLRAGSAHTGVEKAGQVGAKGGNRRLG